MSTTLSQIEPLEGPRYSIIPSFWDVCSTLPDLIATSKELTKISDLEDSESRIDACVRMVGLPLNLVNTLEAAATFLVQAGTATSLFDFSIGWKIGAASTGLFLTSWQAALELLGIGRVSHLLNSLRDKTTKDKLIHLQSRYLTLSPNEKEKISAIAKEKFSLLPNAKELLSSELLAIKQKGLARRIRPWLVKELERDIKGVIEQLDSPDPKVREAGQARGRQLMDHVYTQCRKKLLIHAIGLISLSLSLAGFILSFGLAPLITALLLLLAGSATSGVCYLMDHGLLEHKGWSFDPIPCIPEWLRNVCGIKLRAEGISLQVPRPLKGLKV